MRTLRQSRFQEYASVKICLFLNSYSNNLIKKCAFDFLCHALCVLLRTFPLRFIYTQTLWVVCPYQFAAYYECSTISSDAVAGKPKQITQTTNTYDNSTDRKSLGFIEPIRLSVFFLNTWRRTDYGVPSDSSLSGGILMEIQI